MSTEYAKKKIYCKCGIIQNATHLLECKLVGDGKGRPREGIWKGPEWCAAVMEMRGHIH